MIIPQESALEIKNYLKKLSNVITKQSGIMLMKTKVLNKNLVDDILCCIEANFPEEYRNVFNTTKGRKLKSVVYYNKLLYAIRNKFPLNPSCYAVSYKEALQYIDIILISIDSDISLLYNEDSSKI